MICTVMHPEHHVTDSQHTDGLGEVGGLPWGHQLVMQSPVVDTQRGMQVEPERLGPAEDASNDPIVDRQQPRALPGEELAGRDPPDSRLVTKKVPGSVCGRSVGQVGSRDHVDVEGNTAQQLGHPDTKVAFKEVQGGLRGTPGTAPTAIRCGSFGPSARAGPTASTASLAPMESTSNSRAASISSTRGEGNGSPSKWRDLPGCSRKTVGRRTLQGCRPGLQGQPREDRRGGRRVLGGRHLTHHHANGGFRPTSRRSARFAVRLGW